MEIIATEVEKNIRLDKFLVSRYPEISRARIQKAITDGLVLVNNKKPSKHYFLKPADQININFAADEINRQKEINLAPNKKIKLDIIFADDNYIVVNKPANMIVHPSDIHPADDTLVNGLLAYCPDLKNIGEDPTRPGIVHRLDKDVSGLLVAAKTPAAFTDLKKQFQNHQVYKEYIALVHGRPSKKHDFIKFNIERSKTNGRKMAAKPDNSGREAITEYEVVKEFNNYSLLKVIIHTGRTHQIRVHLNALGYPLVGDNVYCPKSLKSNVDLHRIFLHAHILKFANLAGETLEFKKDLPTDLKTFLDSLS